MDLFQSEIIVNLLPVDGVVKYYGKIIDPEETPFYFQTLLGNIEWKNDEAKIFGKHFITKRKAAWYGDIDFSYTYSNTTKQALPWTPELLKLKSIVEIITGTIFNSCLIFPSVIKRL